jgi:RNA-directed DNA polymerase
MEDRVHTRTYSGTPQGGIVSPILANIYLHELDMFMAEQIAAFERERSVPRTEYGRLAGRIQKQRKRVTMLRAKDNVDEVKVAASLAKIQTLLPQSGPSRRETRWTPVIADFVTALRGRLHDWGYR